MVLALPFAVDQSAVLILASSAASVAVVGGYSLANYYTKVQDRKAEEAKNVIREHVKNHLRMGRPLYEVKQHLIHTGHKEQHVREVVAVLELYHYIYHNLKKGHNAVKIKHALLNFGWDESHVNRVILHASNRLLQQRYSQRHITI